MSDIGERSDISIDYDDDVSDSDWKVPAPQSSDTYNMNNSISIIYEKKGETRDSKTSDKTRAKTDANVKVLCMDLESLLVCPRSKASNPYYKMKLFCHNFTIYDLVSNEAKNYFWQEGDGGT